MAVLVAERSTCSLMSLLIFFVVGSVSLSFICSILEASLLSLTPSYIAQKKLTHPILADKLKRLKDKIDQPLAAILTLNTVAHTVGATGVGAQVVKLYGNGYVALASAVMTLLVLLLSEILPKTIGAQYWRQIAAYLPVILNTMIFVLRPIIWMSDQVMKLASKKEPEYDLRQEIKALTLLGYELNKLDADERRALANILDLREIRVHDIMTPRMVCEALHAQDQLSEVVARIREGQFSRYPVLDENEAPLGIAFSRDILDAASLSDTVAEVMKPIKVVLDKMRVKDLMTMLIQERQHMCLVYDEYGIWMGLVTLEDVFETIIGKPIMDETDSIPDMRLFAKRRWEQQLKKPSTKQP